MKDLLDKYGREITGDDLFKAVLNAKLGDRFRRMQRAHRRKALAAGTALYYIISRKDDPEAALQVLVKRTNVIPPRDSDRCRIIVECLFDYGSTTDEKTRNRQYACTDANALRYLIRKGIEPQKALEPEQGESITKWADLEAEYRKSRKALHALPGMAKTGSSSESAKLELPVIRVSKQHYRVLQKWSQKGLIVIAPKDSGCCPLAVIVMPLRGLTVDQAKSSPAKVRMKIHKALAPA